MNGLKSEKFSSYLSFIIILCISWTYAQTSNDYEGSLSTIEELTASGSWFTSGFMISWTVGDNGDGTWHYEYDFTKPGGAFLERKVSHCILQVSENLTKDDILNGEGLEGPDWFGPGSSNPGLPAVMWGVKVNLGGGNNGFSFDCIRAPMWGDFYAKGGKSGTEWNYVYNSSFGCEVLDPLAIDQTPTGEEGILYKILVPDTIYEPNLLDLYVDINAPNDPGSGLPDDPFKRIQDAIDVSIDGVTIHVAEGIYYENIVINGLDITLMSTDPNDPNVVAATIINGQRLDSVVTITNSNSRLEGFTITNGQADFGGGVHISDGNPIVNSCIFEGNCGRIGAGMYNNNSNPEITRCSFSNNETFEGGSGGGMYNYFSNPTVQDCTFSNNSALYGGGMRNLNCSPIVTNSIFIANSALSGGGMHSKGSKLSLLNCIFDDNRIVIEGGIADDLKTGGRSIYCIDDILFIEDSEIIGIAGTVIGDGSILGNSTLEIDMNDEFAIGGTSIVDLSGIGQIICRGLLRIRDSAKVSNANIVVARASFEGDVNISNSVITAEAGVPYGQFFVEGTATIENNIIYSDGDRYLDLIPLAFKGLIANNEIHVTITEGQEESRGGLLELRGLDGLAETECDPNSFFCKALPGTIPDFDTISWTLEELKLVEGAKVNLFNQIDFGNGGNNEVMYVKNLILEPNSVLNTAFNRLYYDENTIDTSAVIENSPLLGFSLHIITFDDDNEYNLRIKNNNDKEKLPLVQRITDHSPDSSGMMQMTNLMGSQARAKGLFAKSNEVTILIWFEYLFNYDPMKIARGDVELVVYLSGDQELTDNRIEVGRFMAPPKYRPGSEGSGRFGTFREFVNTQGLNFLHGTRVELELLGPDGTSVYINNFDPQVFCREDYCSDVTGDTQITVLDYLTVVGEYGSQADIPKDDGKVRTCLDGLFCKDGYVDLFDVTAWDWLINLPGTPHLCAIPMTDSVSGSASISSASISSASIMSGSDGLTEPSGDLLIAGKRPSITDPAKMEDSLYVFDQTGEYLDSNRCILDHANGRLIQDTEGSLYQMNLHAGIIPLTDANSVLGSCQLSTPSDPRYGAPSDILVGLQGDGDNWVGRPILDAALDNTGHIYVLPVVIDPNGAGDPYQAVAKLLLPTEPNTPPTLVRLYDDPPEEGDNQERDALRELELKDSYLYILNAHSVNESSILWAYNINDSLPESRVELGDPNNTSYIPGPLALHASSQSDMLYLASSLNDPNAGSVTLYQMSTNDFSVTEIPLPGMGHITDITEDSVTGDLWVSGFTMSNIPEYLDLGDDPFYEPYVAHLSSGGVLQEVLDLSADTDPNNNLALPISIQWIGQEDADPCEGADIDDSGDIGLGDLVVMAQAWSSSPSDGNWNADCDLALPADIIDLRDFEVIGRNWLKSGCK